MTHTYKLNLAAFSGTPQPTSPLEQFQLKPKPNCPDPNGPIKPNQPFEFSLKPDQDPNRPTQAKGIWVDSNHNGRYDEGDTILIQVYEHAQLTQSLVYNHGQNNATQFIPGQPKHKHLQTSRLSALEKTYVERLLIAEEQHLAQRDYYGLGEEVPGYVPWSPLGKHPQSTIGGDPVGRASKGPGGARFGFSLATSPVGKGGGLA